MFGAISFMGQKLPWRLSHDLAAASDRGGAGGHSNLIFADLMTV
jgi:hypothetical protein